MIRLLFVLPFVPVNRPNVGESMLRSMVAFEKSGWFVAFSQSARISTLKRSVILNCLLTPASTSKKFGLVKNV